MELIVVSEFRSPRLDYLLDYLFRMRLGLAYKLEKRIPDVNAPVLFYAPQPPESDHALWIPEAGILRETGMDPAEPQVSGWDDVPVLFPKSGSHIPFDLFSALFWMISRYEEYSTEATDEHGRFPSGVALAVRNGFAELPVVDLWIRKLMEVMKSSWPALEYHLPRPFFRLTIDVDQAFAIRGKGLFRTGGAMLRALAGKNEFTPGKYLRVLRGREPDPFDTFGQQSLQKNADVRYFIHCGSWGRYDKNIPPGRKAMKSLLQKRLDGVNGIHPSYSVMDRPSILAHEKSKLEKITGNPVMEARFHYLRFRLPEGYRILPENGILADYSMGWADRPGFRAGTAHPFPWYDLEQELATSLMVFPFPVMDGVLKDRMKLNPEAAQVWLEKLITLLEANGAPFIPLWHNHALSEYGGWQGWKPVFEQMVDMAIQKYSP